MRKIVAHTCLALLLTTRLSTANTAQQKPPAEAPRSSPAESAPAFVVENVNKAVDPATAIAVATALVKLAEQLKGLFSDNETASKEALQRIETRLAAMQIQLYYIDSKLAQIIDGLAALSVEIYRAQEHADREKAIALVRVTLQNFPAWVSKPSKNEAAIQSQLLDLQNMRELIAGHASIANFQTLGVTMRAESALLTLQILADNSRDRRLAARAAYERYVEYFKAAETSIRNLLSTAQGTQKDAKAWYTRMNPDPNLPLHGVWTAFMNGQRLAMRSLQCQNINRLDGSLVTGFAHSGGYSWIRLTGPDRPFRLGERAACHEGDGNELPGNWPLTTFEEANARSQQYRAAAEAEVVTTAALKALPILQASAAALQGAMPKEKSDVTE